MMCGQQACVRTFAYATNAQVVFSFNFENNCNLIPDPSPSTSLFQPTKNTGNQSRTWVFPLIPTSLATMNVHCHLCCFFSPCLKGDTYHGIQTSQHAPVLLSSPGDIMEQSSVLHGPLLHSYFSGISLLTVPSLYSSSLHQFFLPTPLVLTLFVYSSSFPPGV